MIIRFRTILYSKELSVIGIEPVEAMRKQFEAALPGVQVKDGEGTKVRPPRANLLV